MRYLAVFEEPPRGSRAKWGVFFPDLPGCTSGGSSYEDAVSNAREALTMHLEGMKEDGERFPEPRTLKQIQADPASDELFVPGGTYFVLPITARETPGKRVRVNITIEESLLALADKRAEAEGVTRSRMIEDALVVALEE